MEQILKRIVVAPNVGCLVRRAQIVLKRYDERQWIRRRE
jgi:hypothetical protein